MLNPNYHKFVDFKFNMQLYIIEVNLTINCIKVNTSWFKDQLTIQLILNIMLFENQQSDIQDLLYNSNLFFCVKPWRN